MEISQASTVRADASPRDVKGPRLREEFRARGRTGADGALLLWPADALDLVNRAADEGVPIVRITCVAQSGSGIGATRDAADHRIDFTHEVSEGHGCWEAAEAFIARRGELGLLFDVALGDDPLEIV
ncbi:MAG: hypothetical protein ACJ79K_13145 [Gemmatimonadaceae bacterium]